MQNLKSKKVNVGIIGLGVGLKHLEAYLNHNKSNIIAVCDFDKEKLKKIKATYPSIEIVTDSLETACNN